MQYHLPVLRSKAVKGSFLFRDCITGKALLLVGSAFWWNKFFLVFFGMFTFFMSFSLSNGYCDLSVN